MIEKIRKNLSENFYIGGRPAKKKKKKKCSTKLGEHKNGIQSKGF